MDIQENIKLDQYTTFKIGGVARFFAEITTLDEAKEALAFSQKNSLPVFVLGGGSNVLVSDLGFNGLVIHNKIRDLRFEIGGETLVGAGENWDDVVSQAVEKNLAGIECMSGVPSSDGGAVGQNVGAYGQTLSDVVSEVHAIEVATGKLKIFTPQDCEFEYRGSWFKRNPNKYIVVGFKLKLKVGGDP